MPEKNEAPTKEEFLAEVKKGFQGMWPNLEEKEVDAYLSSDEAKELIDNRYNQNLEEFRNGEITRLQFLVGGASSAGYCLSMMY